MEKMEGIRPCNLNATDEVKKVLTYLYEISGKAIITGQHTQTRNQEELEFIQKVTGKLPALCGFELLSYSPNICRETCHADSLKEIDENIGTLETALEWAKKKGLITFTWHWFSPLYNKDKGFYTKNSTFDATRALQQGSKEHTALLYDMDVMANYLKIFQQKNIPILWRPFHESEGDWFWWSAKGPETAKQLYRLMYERYTNYHHLNHLIWVWNSPKKEGYVGDDVVDIISRDLYPKAHVHTDHKREWDELKALTGEQKVFAIAEIGTIPNIPQLSVSQVPWSYYMTWSNEFGRTEQYTFKEELYKAYKHPYAITLDNLPVMY